MPDKKYKHLAHVAPLRMQPLVFMTVATKDRECLLNTPVVHCFLKDTWSRSPNVNGWYVGRYIIMPDHVHLFARAGRDAAGMADWVKAWKSISSRNINRELKRTGAVWQRDYFDRYLRSEDSYSEKWEYVRANPVRAGLAEHPDDWPHQGVICDLMF